MNLCAVWKEEDSLILIWERGQNRGDIFANLLLLAGEDSPPFEEMKEALAPQGMLCTFEQLYENAAATEKDILRSSLPVIAGLVLICLILSGTSVLIIVQNNRLNAAVFLLVGYGRRRVISWIALHQAAVYAAAWACGLLAYRVMGVSSGSAARSAAGMISLGFAAMLWLFSMLVLIRAHKDMSVQIYRSEL